MRLVVPEIERGRLLSVGVDELHAVLLDEVALPQLVEHAQPLKYPVGFRDQRFADVEPREALAFEELDAVAALRDKGRDSRTGWPATNDDNVRMAREVGGGRSHENPPVKESSP